MAAGSSGGRTVSGDGIVIESGLRLLYEDAPAGPLVSRCSGIAAAVLWQGLHRPAPSVCQHVL
jgi:hypothetical protein